jgi:microcystin-dependent protein
MFDIKDIIFVILVIVVIYLLYKTKNVEKFDTVSDVNKVINDFFKADINFIRNLGNLSDKMMIDSSPIILPNNITVADKLRVGGNLLINGAVRFTAKNTNILEIFPKYMVVAWASSNIPKGWAFCDGNSYILNSDGTVSISTLSTAIKTPDLKGRFVLGVGESNWQTKLSKRDFNIQGGKEDHVLTISEIPPHDHSGAYLSTTLRTGDYYGHHTTGYTAHNRQGLTSEKGNNQPHNNMPPFYVLYYIMKL